MRLAKEKKKMSRGDVAGLIERFLESRPLYPGEWFDFVEGRRLEDAELEKIRKRSYELDPLVNCPGEQDARALAELKSIVAELRSRPEGTERK